MTFPEEEGRSNLCDTAVENSLSTSGPKILNDGQLLCQNSNTEIEGCVNPTEGLNDPTEGTEFSNPTEETGLKNQTEETDLKQRVQSQELSASAAEFIPRPVRDRKMPTKYADYEVKSVRTMRAKRLHSSGVSLSTGNRKDHVIWNSNLNPSDSSVRTGIRAASNPEGAYPPPTAVRRRHWPRHRNDWPISNQIR